MSARAAGRRSAKRSSGSWRAAVEAFRGSGRTRGDFAQLWGCSPSSLDKWCQSYDREGPKGLEPKPRAPRTCAKPHPARLPESVRDEGVKVKQEQLHFGLRRIRDFLRRFRGVDVSTGTVRNVLAERGVPVMPVLVLTMR